MIEPVEPSLQTVRRIEYGLTSESVEAAKVLARLHPAGTDSFARADPEHFDLAGGSVVLMGPHLYVNGLFGAGLNGEASEADFIRLEQASKRHSVPAQVSLCSWADQSISSLAGSRGYRASRYRAVMCLPLRASDPTSQIHNTELAIDEVDHELLESFQTTVASAHSVTDPDRRVASDRFSEAMFHARGSSLFVAVEHDEAVATGSLTVSDGLAVLGGMATITSARRRGAQQQMIQHRLDRARLRGADLAITTVQPGSGSQRNLRRAGFHVVYTQIELTQGS